MKRIPVESSNLKSVGYNTLDHVLEIEFNKGDIYQYFNVLPHVVLEMVFEAESIGSYFAKNINRKYEYKKVN